MSLLTVRFRPLFLILALPIYANAISTKTPYCKGEQLAIYQIVSCYPGMSKSITIYGIINNSQESCRLNGSLAAWGTSHQDKIYLSKIAQQNGPSVLVEPATKNYIFSDKLVWFSISGSAAVDGAPFQAIQIMLPGIANHIYTVPYNGYNAIGNPPSLLQKNAALWGDALIDDIYPGFNGKVWPIYFTKTVGCG